MARPRKTGHMQIQAKKVSNNSRSKRREEKGKTTTNHAAYHPSTASSSQLRLLDLPPEVRNRIYHYSLVSNKPIRMQSRRVGRSGNQRFTMIPALVLVSKQLRSETQRIFLEENEFEIPNDILKQENPAPLVALRNMYQKVGIEIQTLHLCRELKKDHETATVLCRADITLSRDEGQVMLVKQLYGIFYASSGKACEYRRICGCDMMECARGPQASAGDIVSFVQWMMTNRWTGSLPYSWMRTPIFEGVECEDCSTPRLPCIYF